jgi:class 3 adenylate cyclase
MEVPPEAIPNSHKRSFGPALSIFRRLQFTFTFQITIALIASFCLGNVALFQIASKRLLANEQRRFRDNVLYLSGSIQAYQDSIDTELAFAANSLEVRSLDNERILAELRPIIEANPLRKWRIWGRDGKLLASHPLETNIRLKEKRILRAPYFIKAINGQSNYSIRSTLVGARLEGCLEDAHPIYPVNSTIKTTKASAILSFCLPISNIGHDSGLINVEKISTAGQPGAAKQHNDYLAIHRGKYNGRLFFMIASSGNLVFPTLSTNQFDHISLLTPRRLAKTKYRAFVDAAADLPLRDTLQRVEVEGHSFFLYAHQVNENWTAVSVVDEQTIYAPLTKNLFELVLIQLLTLLATSIVIFYVCRQLVRPLKSVVSTVSQLSNLEIPEQQPKWLSASNIIEISQVSAAINKLSFAMDSFSRYLPREVVKSVLNSKQSARLGGEVRELVMLFTDIRNFTTYSESSDAIMILDHLNTYMTALTSRIMETSGTIDKYIGDSVMAFWGAPYSVDQPACKSCTAALAVQEETSRLNQEWEKAGIDLQFFTRVGVNIGSVIVGNVGSEERFNYTVIGDPVNLASRLEGTNKLYGTGILVSQAIVDAVNKEDSLHDFCFRLIDRVKVKGKNLSTDVYELVGYRSYFHPLELDDLLIANAIMASSLDGGVNVGLDQLLELPSEKPQTRFLLELRTMLTQRQAQTGSLPI